MAFARFSRSLAWCGFGWVLIAGLAGCQPAHPLESAGLSLTVPGSWQPTNPRRWQVPGAALAAWSGPEGSSLVVYQTLPDPGGTARSIADGLGNRLANLPEMKILSRGVETVAGQSAARLELIAPGSGAALAPTGVGKPVATDGAALISTRQLTIGFPRSRGSLFLTWHTPEQAHDRLAPDIKAALDSLALGPDPQRSTSHY